MALWELEEFAPPVLLGFIRDLLPPPVYRGNTFLPPQTVPDIEVSYIKGRNRKPVMAQIIGWDNEAPLASRQAQGEKVSFELPPIKRKQRITEKELLRFLQPRVNSTDQFDVIGQVYRDMADLVAAVQARVEWLQMQALSEDKLIYNEGGMIIQFDYGVDDTQQIDLVTGLDGAGTDVSASYGPAWSDVANATPITDLRVICDQAEQTTGVRPRRMVLTRKAEGYLLENAQVKGWTYQQNMPDRPLLPDEARQTFARYDLPTWETYDVRLQSENADGSTSEVRPMAEGKAFLQPDTNIGNELWGPTAESRVLLGTPYAQQAPGIWGNVYDKDEPPSEWTKVVGVTFPSMPNVDQLVQMKLFA